MESVLEERTGQLENKETVPTERMREEVEQERGEARVIFYEKGVKNFKEILAKKGIIGERGFKEIMPPFKEEIKIR